MLRALLQVAGWTVVSVLSVVAVLALIGFGANNAENPSDPVKWLALAISVGSAAVSYAIYRKLALTEARTHRRRERAPEDDTGMGLPDLATQVSDRFFRGGLGAFPFIFGAAFLYLALLIPMLLITSWADVWLGINFEDTSVWVTLLAGAQLAIVFIGPIVVVVIAYRRSISWLRRRAPRWLRFFGLD